MIIFYYFTKFNNYLYIINTYIPVTTDGFISVSSTTEQPTDSCQLSEFGCCPDGVSTALGFNLEGCIGIDFDNCTYNENGAGNSENNNVLPYLSDALLFVICLK